MTEVLEAIRAEVDAGGGIPDVGGFFGGREEAEVQVLVLDLYSHYPFLVPPIPGDAAILTAPRSFSGHVKAHMIGQCHSLKVCEEVVQRVPVKVVDDIARPGESYDPVEMANSLSPVREAAIPNRVATYADAPLQVPEHLEGLVVNDGLFPLCKLDCSHTILVARSIPIWFGA